MGRTPDFNWLVTGATGFIGRELVCRILQETSDSITLLVRSAEGQSARERVDAMLCELHCVSHDPQRVEVVDFDLNKPLLGIDDDKFALLAKQNNILVHLAANTNFDEALANARKVNLDGVVTAADLASKLHEKGALHRFVYVSTAYVHGYLKGSVTDDAELRPELARNAYERSKAEAETYIQSLTSTLPLTIFRPSIVVGDSVTGRMSGFGTIYWAIKLYCRGHHRFFANPDARLDIVPVDYVVSALMMLSQSLASTGETYPLVSGDQRDITIQQLSDAIAKYYQLKEPVLMNPEKLQRYGTLASMASITLGQRVVFEQMRTYLPYFTENPRFDSSKTDLALADTALGLKPFSEYSDVVFNYCEQLGWCSRRVSSRHSGRQTESAA